MPHAPIHIRKKLQIIKKSIRKSKLLRKYIVCLHFSLSLITSYPAPF